MLSRYSLYNRTVDKLLKLIPIFILILSSMFTFYNLFPVTLSTASENNNEWEIMLNITEPNGANDFLIFGEKVEASDGKDQFDLPKPPAPQPPYIRSWFTTSLESPYNILWKDYRPYSEYNKMWNLTIFWLSDTSEKTNITISWDMSEFENSRYDSIILIAFKNVDMTTENNYQFLANSNVPYSFQISIKDETLNEKSTDDQTYLLGLIFIITILIILIITVSIKKFKK